jgi:hypothetical protein
LKWSDTEWLIAVNGQFPVCHELISMDIDPDLHHPKLTRRKVTGKNATIVNCYRSLFPLVSHMNVGCMVLFIVCIENGNNSKDACGRSGVGVLVLPEPLQVHDNLGVIFRFIYPGKWSFYSK